MKAIFQPTVTVDVDGNVDVQWTDSFVWIVDDQGDETDDEEFERSACALIDECVAPKLPGYGTPAEQAAGLRRLADYIEAQPQRKKND